MKHISSLSEIPAGTIKKLAEKLGLSEEKTKEAFFNKVFLSESEPAPNTIRETYYADWIMFEFYLFGKVKAFYPSDEWLIENIASKRDSVIEAMADRFKYYSKQILPH